MITGINNPRFDKQGILNTRTAKRNKITKNRQDRGKGATLAPAFSTWI